MCLLLIVSANSPLWYRILNVQSQILSRSNVLHHRRMQSTKCTRAIEMMTGHTKRNTDSNLDTQNVTMSKWPAEVKSSKLDSDLPTASTTITSFPSTCRRYLERIQISRRSKEGHDSSAKIDVPRIDTDELQASVDERLTDSPITAYHRYLNEEAALHYNDAMFDRYLRYGSGDNYAGPDALAKWYQRNLRMVHNIWRTVDAETERALLVVGASHVHYLRHLLTEFPQFCPISPLSYLPRDE